MHLIQHVQTLDLRAWWLRRVAPTCKPRDLRKPFMSRRWTTKRWTQCASRRHWPRVGHHVARPSHKIDVRTRYQPSHVNPPETCLTTITARQSDENSSRRFRDVAERQEIWKVAADHILVTFCQCQGPCEQQRWPVVTLDCYDRVSAARLFLRGSGPFLKTALTGCGHPGAPDTLSVANFCVFFFLSVSMSRCALTNTAK